MDGSMLLTAIQLTVAIPFYIWVIYQVINNWPLF